MNLVLNMNVYYKIVVQNDLAEREQRAKSLVPIMLNHHFAAHSFLLIAIFD